MNEFSDIRMLERWEDWRAIKNLMGKYTSSILIKKEREIFGLFWSRSCDDVCLTFNNGSYVGADAIRGYYDAVDRNTRIKAAVIKNAFADKLKDKSADELYGAGPFDNLPVSTPLIELAGDGLTAKGLWQCTGSYADVTVSGPVSYWTWGYYAVDFIKEDGEWRIWHLVYVNDVDTICGQTWVCENIPYPEVEAFAVVRECSLPEYSVSRVVRELYSETRPFTRTPRLPEAYDAFSDTFSYGI